MTEQSEIAEAAEAATAPEPANETRRDRLRRELTAQIVDIGRAQLHAGGVSGVSWRAIAREVGMNPASLYTYVDGVDDLYTRILVDSFGRLSTSIRTAVDDRSPDDDRSPRRRLIDGAIAFRRWAIDNPNEFNLIYTDQIPGYEAPVGGPTVDAELAVGWPFIELIADMLGEDDPGRLVEDDGTDRHVGVYGLRALMHGFASLEANSHAPYTNDRSDLMIMALERFLDDMIERCGSA